jgi:hypothetical protein
MPEPTRLTAWATVAIVVLVTASSGPVVGGVSFVDERITAMDVAPGNATVGEISFPERVTLIYEGDGRYRYDAAALRVPFERIRGGDVQLTYGLLVPELNSSRSVTQIVSGPKTDETVAVDFYDYVSADPVRSGTYEGTAYVALISEGEDDLVAKASVPVEVRNGTN